MALLLISHRFFAFMLLSEYQGRLVCEVNSADIEMKMPNLRAETLTRLAEICAEDGIAVLELEDTGAVFLVENAGDEFIVWHVRAQHESINQADLLALSADLETT